MCCTVLRKCDHPKIHFYINQFLILALVFFHIYRIKAGIPALRGFWNLEKTALCEICVNYYNLLKRLVFSYLHVQKGINLLLKTGLMENRVIENRVIENQVNGNCISGGIPYERLITYHGRHFLETQRWESCRQGFLIVL